MTKTFASSRRAGTAGSASPWSDWSAVGAHGHAVQFYRTDGHLLDLLTRFIGTALVTGDVGIIIATKLHRDGLVKRCKSRGLDVNVARDEGRFVSLDAAATLSRVMLHGRPDKQLFRDVVGGIFERVAPQGQRRRIAAFGEMVALLWADRDTQSALALEVMWNELARERAFCLCCAYPMEDFGNHQIAPFMQICAQHTHVFTVAQASPMAEAVGQVAIR